MTERVLVTGAEGQLGCELKALVNMGKMADAAFFFTSRNNLDICSPAEVKAFCTKNKITIIINCAAYTKVDPAEDDADTADRINHIAVQHLAEISHQLNIRLIHISTDYVFDGEAETPYTPESQTNPVSVYGKTKLLGEQAIQKIHPDNSAIIRTSWLYSGFGNNFVKTMIKLGRDREDISVVSDQLGSPTYAKDLAAFILQQLNEPGGSIPAVQHYSNTGQCSWYEFAVEIFKLLNIDCTVKPIPASEYPTRCKRPAFSVLQPELSADKNHYRPWQDALTDCLSTIES